MRRGTAAPNANLVAAATRIRLDDKKAAQAQAAKRQKWQDEAWAVVGECPEVKQAMLYTGNALSKLGLYAATRPPDAAQDSEPIPVEHESAGLPAEFVASCRAEVDRLGTGQGGLPGLLRAVNVNFEAVGEAYLVGRGEVPPGEDGKGGSAEEWFIRSISEVEARGGVYRLKKSPNDRGEALDAERDACIRLWMPDAQWHDQADCAMNGVLGEARILQVLSQQVMAQAMRSASAGFLTLANELSFAVQINTAGGNGEGDLMDLMADILVAPIEDPSDPHSVQPGLIRGPAEYLKPDVLRHIKLWDPAVDKSLEERIAARVIRIARGLNLPVERITGFMATTFENARQINKDEFDDYLQPRCVVVVDAFTSAFFRPNLSDAGYPPELVNRVFIWYDPSGIVGKPDTEAHAAEAHKDGVISAKARRKAEGFGDDDAPEPGELLLKIALERGTIPPALTLALLQPLAEEAGITLPDVSELPTDAAQSLVALLSNGHAPRRRAITAAVRPRTRRQAGSRLAAIDRDLRTRLLVASNAAMERALERAGSRLRSKAAGQGTSLSRVPAKRVGYVLGRGHGFATDDELMAGAWDDLGAQWDAWVAAGGADALDALDEIDEELADRRADLLAQQESDRSSAWLWLAAALGAAAAVLLYDPHPEAPALGEVDTSLLIPPGLVRQALARAGGANGLAEGGAPGSMLLVADGGNRPAGELATGELVRSTLRDDGIEMGPYLWVYGPAPRTRPFEPHVLLDGTEFEDFDDERLIFDDWPSYGGATWPGDHAGCCCAIEPLVGG